MILQTSKSSYLILLQHCWQVMYPFNITLLGIADPEMKGNPAYEIHNIRTPSGHMTSSVQPIANAGRGGVEPSAGDGVSVERCLNDNEAFNMELNDAYGP